MRLNPEDPICRLYKEQPHFSIHLSHPWMEYLQGREHSAQIFTVWKVNKIC